MTDITLTNEGRNTCDDRNNDDETNNALAFFFFYRRYDPLRGFSLLSDFLPFRPFLTQLSPPSYSHYLYIFDVLSPSFPWSSSFSPTCWIPL